MRFLPLPVLALLAAANPALAQSKGPDPIREAVAPSSEQALERARERTRALLDPALYAETKARWLARVEAAPDDVAVLDGAADFFMIRDRALSEQLLERARAVQPDNYQWPQKLAQVHKLNATSGDLNEARLALVEMERAYELMPASVRRFPPDLAVMAFEAGDLTKARTYAEQLIDARSSSAAWQPGDAVHKANLVLGRIALGEGRIADAVKFLQASAMTDGSPSLGSFGPNMQLAKDLLAFGERAAVLAYLERCRTFWKMGGERLDRWTEEVRAGITPDFGPNLRY
jgi:hypothetical protein